MACGMLMRARHFLIGLVCILGASGAVAQSGNPPDTADPFVVNKEIQQLIEEGKFEGALLIAKRALEVSDRTLGVEHPITAMFLNTMALIYDNAGRYGEAEPLYIRSIAVFEKALGTDHPSIAMPAANLAGVYEKLGRFEESEAHYLRSLRIREKAFGTGHPEVGHVLHNIAGLYDLLRRYDEAERLYSRSLAIREKELGHEHRDVGVTLNNLAYLYSAQRRYGEAEQMYKRSLQILEKELGSDHFYIGHALHNLAGLYLEQQKYDRALEFWRRSTTLTVRRAQRGEAIVGAEASQDAHDRLSRRFFGFLKAAHRLAEDQVGLRGPLSAEGFEIAQWAHDSKAADALALMASRGAKGDAGLALIVRERQDLVAEWLKRDGEQAAAASLPPDKRDRVSEGANAIRIHEIERRVTEIDSRLKVDFPDYAALAIAGSLSISDVQAELRSDEALVLITSTPDMNGTPDETFIWIVSKTNARWIRSYLGAAGLSREVSSLRCGLDATAWSSEDGSRKCAELLKIPQDRMPKAGEPLPYDHARAHLLYQALLGEVTDLIEGKHLLLAVSGPLTSLPFQVLIKETPNSDQHRDIRWLAREHALTVLPAVSSLKALRRLAKPSGATRQMIGFGNPLLDGDQGDPQFSAYYKERAGLARANQNCPRTPLQRISSWLGTRRSIQPIATRGGIADLAHLRAQLPLPETAKELCDVATSLKADHDGVFLGARATEREIKRMSSAGGPTRLANYRIVHFATHGALSGQLKGTSEPGLILTPPDHATSDDDGYLSASEIAGLKFDADWVILSACNTAGGGGGDEGAEALSGLARAFFYAQARAMLVSHWEVNSDATVKLITSAVAASQSKSIGRAEALRRAMLSTIDNGSAHEAHPAYWAPFVLVGEGAAPN